MAPAPDDSRPTTRLGPYTLRHKLGEGGMGEVHLAHDSRLERQVALKLLPAALRDDQERRARFLREARAAAQLSHPNVTQIFDVGEADGTDYIAFELVDGDTLTEVLARGSLGVPQIVDLALPLADALSYAHERGVLHRDLKADNVMVTRRGHPKLLDFGLAKVLQEGSRALDARSTTLTVQGAIFGTPAAMSPEQALGRQLDARSDVFSFGSLLYHMACGRQAFGGTTVMEIIDAVIHRDPPALARARADLPPDFVAIVEKALRKDPGERYQTMSDLAADLRHFKRTTDSGLVPPGGVRRRRLPFAVLAAVVGLASIGVAVWALRPPESGGSGGGTPTGRGQLLAIVGFENLLDPSDKDALGRMLTGLVTTDLAEHGGVRVVSTSKVLASLESIRPGTSGGFEAATATRAAKAVGATTMLVGQIARAGSGLLISAELVDVDSGETRGSLRADAASGEQVFAIAGKLAAGARARLGVAESAGRFELSSLTDSPEAYREFTAGELALHHRDFVLAATFFERAIAADGSFAMAHLRRGLTRSWVDGHSGGDDYDRALQYSDRLSERYQILCKAAAARTRDDFGTAHALIAPLVQGGTDLPEAWNEYGEVLTHSCEFRDPPGARRAFERALELDPRFELVVYHLINERIAAEDPAGAKALVEQMSRAGTAPYGAAALLLGERRHAETVAVCEAEVAATGRTDWESYIVAARYVDDAAVWSRAFAAWEVGAARERRWQHLQRAFHDYRHGRFDRAFGELTVGERLTASVADRLWMLDVRAMAAYGIGDDDALAAAVARAVKLDRFALLSRFWLGSGQVRAGRIDDAERTLAEARAVMAQSRNTVAPSALDCLAALIAAGKGEHEQARSLIAGSRARPPECRPRELELMAAARVFEACGEVEAARAAWQGLVDPTHPRHTDSFDLDAWPIYELGRFEHEHGGKVAARQALRRFLGYWGEADRPLPIVADARRRLAELGD